MAGPEAWLGFGPEAWLGFGREAWLGFAPVAGAGWAGTPAGEPAGDPEMAVSMRMPPTLRAFPSRPFNIRSLGQRMSIWSRRPNPKTEQMADCAAMAVASERPSANSMGIGGERSADM